MIHPLQLLRFHGGRTLPMVLQTEMAECGLACLAMISCYHGHEVDLNTLRRRFPVSLKGATLKSLMETADRLELSARALRLEIDDLAELKTPAILHWDLNHFVVLKSVSRQRVVILDPATGERNLSQSEVGKHFTGIALELAPAPGFKPRRDRQHMRLSDFWQRITGVKKALVQLFALSLALQLFALAMPFYMQLVVDHALVSHDSSLLAVLALGFMLLTLIQVGTETLRGYVVMVLGNTLNIQMVSNLFRHLIRLPLCYFENRHIGDVVSRFRSVGHVKDMLSTGMVEAFVDGVLVLSTLALMFIYSQVLGWVTLGFAILYLVVRWISFRPYRRLTEESIVAQAKEQSNFMETVRGMQSIKLFNREVDRHTLWQNRYADEVNAGIRVTRFQIAFNSVDKLLTGAETILVIYLAAKMVLANTFTVGMLYAFMSYKRQFTAKVDGLIDKFIQFRMLELHFDRIADIAKTREETDLLGETLGGKQLNGELELANIAFRHTDGDPYLFMHLNLRVNPGETLAIVGPSGAGKSTLLKIMLGLLLPDEGSVLVDGQDIRKLGLQNFRAQTAAVMQEDQLFAGTIADNIASFDPQCDLDWVERCADLSGIHQEITAMPMGYNSLVGDMGTTLSGGQKQRVLLARALYRKPRILFLDESTSHLDVQTEQRVNAAVGQLRLTRVIIAHRPETIRLATRVLALINGRLQAVTPAPASPTLAET